MKSPIDYLTRFAFGAGISAVAAIVAVMFGARLGGVLLAFPAILPASLTLIERREGRHEAMVDATGAILGSFALIGFALVATWALPRFNPAEALVLASAAWTALALMLYVLIVRLPRRRKKRAKRAKPTTT